MNLTTTPVQAWYRAERHAADANEAFLFLVEHGMTKEELAACIAKRPSLWQRYAHWLDKLPSKA